MDTTGPGIYCQSRQVCVHTSPRDQVTGSGSQFSDNEAQSVRGEAS